MSAPCLLSVVALPSFTAKPSIARLQWSDDGQLFFAAKRKVHVLTPHHLGIASTGKVPHDDETTDTRLRWLRTVIDVQRKDICNWTDFTQEWATLSLGSVDYHVRAVACSPSGLTESGGCVAAVLTSNMDLTLWGAAKNAIHGEWVKIFEVTPFLVSMQDKSQEAIRRLLQAQIASVTWSGQARFGLSPAPCIDASLLVTGSRAGTLCFLRFDAKIGRLQHMKTLQVADTWLTHLSFSPWTVINSGFCESWLAYNSSDGSVGLVKLQFMGKFEESSPVLGSDYAIESSFGNPTNDIFATKDECGTTALNWVVSGDKVVLVRCRPGVIDLWSPPSSTAWSGSRSLYIPPQVITVGSSILQPVSGLAYFRQYDVLVIGLFDGTVRTIHNLFLNPEWDVNTATKLTGQLVSEGLRRIFVEIENEEITNADVNRTSGLISLDGFASVVLTQQSSQPDDMSVKNEGRQTTHFVAAQLCHTDQIQDTLLNELVHILTTANSDTGAAPIHLLRPIFLWLESFPELHFDILKALRSITWNPPTLRSLTPWLKDSGSDLRLRFRKSLKRDFYGCDGLLSLRLRLQVTEANCATLRSVTMKEECYETAHSICKLISDVMLRVLIRHLSAVTSVLSSSDMPFILRVIRRASQADSPPNTQREVHALLGLIGGSDPSCISRLENELDEAVSEPCPACKEPVNMETTARPACINGHTWDSCVVSSFIMATPFVRSCIGCKRKAFLPSSMRSTFKVENNWLPTIAQSWIVDELLEAVTRCLYCGNSFIVTI
ncbi:hypothetical protein BDZ89DRAFT_953917 [Hymenopellis radicata]|nr:hypothetical protein BDZ89DRAFT_953917 [Hymenopellis radicata]